MFLGEILARLPSTEQEMVTIRTAELVAREMSLRDLRKALDEIQRRMADSLGIKQENVSRIEQRSDMLLSTLDSYLQGLGGRLRLVADFEGRPSIELAGLSDLAGAGSSRQKMVSPQKQKLEAKSSKSRSVSGASRTGKEVFKRPGQVRSV